MNCSFKSHILSEYGKETVALIRRYSKGKESIARHRNNIIFDLRCKKHGSYRLHYGSNHQSRQSKDNVSQDKQDNSS